MHISIYSSRRTAVTCTYIFERRNTFTFSIRIFRELLRRLLQDALRLPRVFLRWWINYSHPLLTLVAETVVDDLSRLIHHRFIEDARLAAQRSSIGAPVGAFPECRWRALVVVHHADTGIELRFTEVAAVALTVLLFSLSPTALTVRVGIRTTVVIEGSATHLALYLFHAASIVFIRIQGWLRALKLAVIVLIFDVSSSCWRWRRWLRFRPRSFACSFNGRRSPRWLLRLLECETQAPVGVAIACASRLLTVVCALIAV